MSEWCVPARYRLGDHATWRGVDLVCTRVHYAGDEAVHPWDPGDGWPAARAAALWAPNGADETKKLAALLAAREPGDRLYAVLCEAVGKS